MTKMLNLAELLAPPARCRAYLGLPFKDRRKGGIWYCKHARKIIGSGKVRPACLCAVALADAKSVLEGE